MKPIILALSLSVLLAGCGKVPTQTPWPAARAIAPASKASSTASLKAAIAAALAEAEHLHVRSVASVEIAPGVKDVHAFVAVVSILIGGPNKAVYERHVYTYTGTYAEATRTLVITDKQFVTTEQP